MEHEIRQAMTTVVSIAYHPLFRNMGQPYSWSRLNAPPVWNGRTRQMIIVKGICATDLRQETMDLEKVSGIQTVSKGIGIPCGTTTDEVFYMKTWADAQSLCTRTREIVSRAGRSIEGKMCQGHTTMKWNREIPYVMDRAVLGQVIPGANITLEHSRAWRFACWHVRETSNSLNVHRLRIGCTCSKMTSGTSVKYSRFIYLCILHVSRRSGAHAAAQMKEFFFFLPPSYIFTRWCDYWSQDRNKSDDECVRD